ncbi:MAG: excinuclease ABC subunit UvrC [Candidatus Dormibacteria bacterium]
MPATTLPRSRRRPSDNEPRPPAGRNGPATRVPSARLVDKPELLRARLRAAPTGPGVYLFRDLAGRVAYVGKAANVRSRLRSHFTAARPRDLQERGRPLTDRVFDFEVVDCLNEREALILENTLIKRHRPRYNVRLKDDKNYLYLKVPHPGAADILAPGTAREQARDPRGGRPEGGAPDPSRFPRPFYTRRLARDGARYYGPYTSAQSLRTTVKSLRAVLPFRTCGDEVFRRGRVCLDYHIKRCSGPCEGRVDEAGYGRLLDQVQLFMEGHSAILADELRDQMASAAGRFDYEQAARYRDRLRAVDRLGEQQKMVGGGRADEDCVAIAIEAGRGMVATMSIRDGKVTGLVNHEIEGVTGLSSGECLEAFLTQFYGTAPLVPRTILLSEAIPEQEQIAGFLAGQRGGPVELRVARRGRARGLTEQAQTTALSALRQRRIVEDFDADRRQTLLADLAERLDLPEPPHRIECYDISNTMGTNSVGSMIVFEDGRPSPAHYRHFGIRTVEGADDFASMAELLRRRFRRYLLFPAGNANAGGDDIPVQDPAGSNGETADPERPARRPRMGPADESFSVLPDVVFVDGGRGQLSAARAVAEEAGLGDLAILGLAKRNEELFTPESPDPIVIPRDSPTLFLVQRIRDEAHRFAITRHRARRGRSALRSRLDSVPGLGPARKRVLLRHFGSLDGIREASLDELTAVPGIPRTVAMSIKELL